MRLPRPLRPDSARRGISLLAILVSLCAVAIVAVVAIPGFFARHDVTLDNACRLLLKDVRSAQNRSSYLKTGAVFAFHADGWEATTPAGELLASRGTLDGIARQLSRDGVFEGVSIENIDFGDDDRFAFDERGLALEGGSLEIVFRGERRFVTIDQGTGLALATDEQGSIVAGDAFAQDVMHAAGRGTPRAR